MDGISPNPLTGPTVSAEALGVLHSSTTAIQAAAKASLDLVSTKSAVPLIPLSFPHIELHPEKQGETIWPTFNHLLTAEIIWRFADVSFKGKRLTFAKALVEWIRDYLPEDFRDRYIWALIDHYADLVKKEFPLGTTGKLAHVESCPQLSEPPCQLEAVRSKEKTSLWIGQIRPKAFLSFGPASCVSVLQAILEHRPDCRGIQIEDVYTLAPDLKKLLREATFLGDLIGWREIQAHFIRGTEKELPPPFARYYLGPFAGIVYRKSLAAVRKACADTGLAVTGEQLRKADPERFVDNLKLLLRLVDRGHILFGDGVYCSKISCAVLKKLVKKTENTKKSTLLDPAQFTLSSISVGDGDLDFVPAVYYPDRDNSFVRKQIEGVSSALGNALYRRCFLGQDVPLANLHTDLEGRLQQLLLWYAYREKHSISRPLSCEEIIEYYGNPSSIPQQSSWKSYAMTLVNACAACKQACQYDLMATWAFVAYQASRHLSSLEKSKDIDEAQKVLQDVIYAHRYSTVHGTAPLLDIVLKEKSPQFPWMSFRSFLKKMLFGNVDPIVSCLLREKVGTKIAPDETTSPELIKALWPFCKNLTLYKIWDVLDPALPPCSNLQYLTLHPDALLSLAVQDRKWVRPRNLKTLTLDLTTASESSVTNEHQLQPASWFLERMHTFSGKVILRVSTEYLDWLKGEQKYDFRSAHIQLIRDESEGCEQRLLEWICDFASRLPNVRTLCVEFVGWEGDVDLTEIVQEQSLDQLSFIDPPRLHDQRLWQLLESDISKSVEIRYEKLKASEDIFSHGLLNRCVDHQKLLHVAGPGWEHHPRLIEIRAAEYLVKPTIRG